MSDTKQTEQTSTRERYTVEEVAAALRASHGIYTAAAARLGCARMTVAYYVERHPELAAVRAEAREVVLDKAESALVRLVDADDPGTVRWLLGRLGASRGYADPQRHEISGPGGGPVEVKVTSELIDKVISDVYRMPAGEEGDDGDD